MKKILIVAAGLLVLTVLAAVLVLPRLVDPERYRPQIEGALRDATGWEASLGDMGLRILGGTALTVHDVTLADPPSGFHMEVDEFRVGVALLPLLKRRLEVTRIEVLRPSVTLRWTGEGLQLPSLPEDSGSGQPAGETTGEPAFSVVVNRIAARDGTLILEHTAGQTPQRWALTGFDATLLPGSRELEMNARAGSGTVKAGGVLGEQVTLELDAIRSEELPPWLLGDLLQPGGTLSGTVKALLKEGSPRITAHLTASGLLMEGGEAPLDDVTATLEVVRNGSSFVLRELQLQAAGATLTGSGPLTPDLGLHLKLGPSPIESALRIARAARPIPLHVKGPGNLESGISLRATGGGVPAIGASGVLSAASVTLAEGLPDVRDARITFELDPSGKLTARLTAGTFADGPVTGTFALSPVNPPGKLALDARLEDADVAGFLRAIGSAQADRISGRASGTARLTTDLSRGLPGPAGLRGELVATLADLTLPGWDLLTAVTGQLAKGGSWKEMLQAVAGAGQEGTAGPATFRKARLEVAMEGLPWKVRRLDLDGGDLTAEGSGTFEPVKGTVALELRTRLGPEQSRKIVKNASFLASLQDEKGRIVVPVTVRGPLTEPCISVDLEGVLTDTEGDVGGLVGGLIDSLLGGGEKK